MYRKQRVTIMIIIFFDFVSKKLIIFDANDPIQMDVFTKNKIK